MILLADTLNLMIWIQTSCRSMSVRPVATVLDHLVLPTIVLPITTDLAKPKRSSSAIAMAVTDMTL